MPDVFEEIKNMLSHLFGIDPENIEEDSLVDDDLSITDLDMEDLISAIQEKYEIEIPQEKIASFKKVSDIVSYIYENTEPSA